MLLKNIAIHGGNWFKLTILRNLIISIMTKEEEKKAYSKAYYEANKKKLKAHYDANKEEKKAYDKAYYKANKEKVKEYRDANKEKNKAYSKAYYQVNKDKSKAYREANKEKIKAYYKYNKEEKKAYSQVYRKSIKHKPLVYLLPKENYVGTTECISYRISQHKNVGRNTEKYKILKRFENREDALVLERKMHNIGFSGKHANNSYQ